MTEPTGTLSVQVLRHGYQVLAQNVCRLVPGADMETVDKCADSYHVEIRTDRKGIMALLEDKDLVHAGHLAVMNKEWER